MTKVEKTSPAFLSDNETNIDLLSNESIAATIIKILLEYPERPVTIGVHGDWGAGKSSVLEMIDAGVANKDGVLCLKFNGWRFQGFEDAKIALLEGIVTGLLEERPALSKATEKVKSVFRRIDWLKVAKNAGGLAITAFTGIPPLSQVQSVLSTLDTLVRDPTSRPPKEKIDEAFDNVYSLLKPDVPSKNVPEEIGEFRKAFDDLLDDAKIKRLIVLIDDLDRCLPDTAIETLEAVRLFVFTSRTAFVVAADEAMIEYAVRKHFPDLPDSTGPQTYARNYLEKLIQIPFRIPPLGITETRIYITLLLVGASLTESDPDFRNLIVAARERLKRPWAGQVIDAALIRDNLGNKASAVSDALILSDQIGPILANGARGNPRQIKRFLNALILRKRTADARGFGDDIKIPVLAKLMLAERFMSRMFDQIANSVVASPNGTCEDLKLLEATFSKHKQESVAQVANRFVSKDDDKKKDIQTESEKETKSAQLSEWLSSQWTIEWAALQPMLADVDLRPYLFVTKDRKDYFGTTTVLGKLDAIAEELLGPKIMVQAKEEDIKRLAVPEAASVFELIRSRIISQATFDKEPAGIAGLAVLVKAHPALQPNLLDFLESLPVEHLGLWAVQGWNDVIKNSESMAQLERLLKKWGTNTTNKPLQVAAKAILQTPKRGS